MSMSHNEKVKTIEFIRPNAEFVLRGDDVEWLDKKQKQPSDQEIEDGYVAYQNKLKADIEAAEEAKKIAEAKLAALGLTTNDLKALGLA